MIRTYLLSIFLAWFITPNLGLAQCNTNLGDLSGFQTPQENAAILDSAACELALVLGDTTFKVFHTSFYAEQEYYGYYKYPDAFELQRQEAMAQCESYLLIGWQNDSKGINSQFFVDLKLGDVPGTGCVENFPELAKGFLVDRIQKEYDSYYSSPQSASLSAGFGIRKLVEYINDLKSCCQQGGNVEECIACEKPSGTKAYLTALGFRSVQIYNIHPTGQTSSGTIEDLAGLEFMIEDLSTVKLAEQYTNVVSAFGAENLTVKVIITKDEIMCTQQWDDLLDMAKSGQYDVVYWHHIHKGSGPGDQWMYTHAWIKGGQGTGNKPDSTDSKRVATNVVAALASAATDFLFQVLAHYAFDDDINSGEWGKAVGRVNYWEVSKSAVFGLFGINSKVAAIASALANATVKEIDLANYYTQHPPNPQQYPEGYTLRWAAGDFGNYFLEEIINEGKSMLLGAAVGKAVGVVTEIPFYGWCKIAKLLNRSLGTTIPGCFPSGTLVSTPVGLIPIEHLQPGDWALSNPDCSPYQFAEIEPEKDDLRQAYGEDLADVNNGVANLDNLNPQKRKTIDIPAAPEYDFKEIIPGTWTIVDLEANKADGGICIIRLLRPNEWLTNEGLSNIGDTTWLNFPEMGINGMAKAIGFTASTLDTRSAESRKLLEQGYYPVLASFKHKADAVLHLQFTNADKIAVTAPHPFWSLDRDGWVAAESLKDHEAVKTSTGIATIDNISIENGSVAVYNIEVWKAHNYFVGERKYLVHNGCDFSTIIDVCLKRWGVIIKRAKPRFTDGLPSGYAFYTTRQLNNQTEKVFYSRFGFPDFRKWVSNKNHCFVSDDLNGSSIDFKNAYNWLKSQVPEGKIAKGDSDSYSPFKLFINGEWKQYTWHHHEDARTLMPVLSEIHNAVAHTGGASMLEKVKWLFTGLFNGPNWDAPIPE